MLQNSVPQIPSGLDVIDLRILDLMQRDATMSSADVADRVGLSQSPCWRRMQKLREEGYITDVVALVNPSRMGFNIQIFAQLKMVALSEADRAKFDAVVETTPEIIESWSVFGDTDAMLRIVAPDAAWYQEFIFSVLLKLPGVCDVRSIVTFLEPKRSTAIPLGPRRLR